MAVGECLELCLLSTHNCTVVSDLSQNSKQPFYSSWFIYSNLFLAANAFFAKPNSNANAIMHGAISLMSTYTKSEGFFRNPFSSHGDLHQFGSCMLFNAHVAHRLADKGNWIKLIWLERLAQSSASGQSFANAVRPKGLSHGCEKVACFLLMLFYLNYYRFHKLTVSHLPDILNLCYLLSLLLAMHFGHSM